MRVQTCVPGRARQALPVLVWNVLPCPRVAVPLGQPEVDDVHVVLPLPEAHEKVVGLDVPVQVQPRVDVLDSLDHLVGQHQHRLQTEFPSAFPEKFFEAASERIHDHNVSFFVLAEPVHLRDADAVVQNLVDLVLVEKLRLAHGHWLLLGKAVLLVPIFRVDVLQILNFHGVCEFLDRPRRLVGEALQVDAGPDLAEAARAELLLALVLRIYVLLGPLLWSHLLEHIHAIQY